ncbi:hypothetical protein [Brevibacterium paucivorans]
MNKLELMAHKVDVNARVFAGAVAEKLQKRREAGQGSIEYIGIAVIAAIIVAAIIAFFNDKGNKAITDGLQKIIKGIFSKTPEF